MELSKQLCSLKLAKELLDTGRNRGILTICEPVLDVEERKIYLSFTREESIVGRVKNFNPIVRIAQMSEVKSGIGNKEGKKKLVPIKNPNVLPIPTNSRRGIKSGIGIQKLGQSILTEEGVFVAKNRNRSFYPLTTLKEMVMRTGKKLVIKPFTYGLNSTATQVVSGFYATTVIWR